MESSKSSSQESCSSTYSATSFHNDIVSLTDEDYFISTGQYDCPCIGSVYGCPAMTNGTQYCYKYYCPYEDEANENNVFEKEQEQEAKKPKEQEAKKPKSKVKSHSI